MIWVASYCRVSTDQEDQVNSFLSQQRFFKEFIRRRSDWSLYKVYADEGISGTSTRKRTAFQSMIGDAYAGKFGLILTKEVSRFSRNILDTIAYTRELKRLGVGVIFMNDGINTLEPDAELRLSIMGSIAQEESRKTSDRVKWGQTRQMEQGVVFGRSLLGYRLEKGRLTVEPEEAELVRLIFRKYTVERKGTSVIAKELQAAGYLTHRGNRSWSGSHIVKILRNEKYAGDLVQKKTITPDYLTHYKRYNHGEEPMVIQRNHHEPIISRALWEATQQELIRRRRKSSCHTGGSVRYPFSGKMICGSCGVHFVSRLRKGSDGNVRQYWSCAAAVRQGKAGCGVGTMIRNELAEELFYTALRSMKEDTELAIAGLSAVLTQVMRKEQPEVRKEQAALSALRQKQACALDAFFSGAVSEQEMRMMCDRYNREALDIHARLQAEELGNKENRSEKATEYAREIFSGQEKSDVMVRTLLEQMVVRADQTIEVRLKSIPKVFRFKIRRKE